MSISVETNCTTLRAARRIEYRVFHPAQPVFDPADRTLAGLADSRPVLAVFDRSVAALYNSAWKAYAARHLQLAGELTLAPGESAKNWEQVHNICALAARVGLPRHGIILGIGGGITLDIAGFAASIFRRGIDYVRIPTTLVGLVDVAVGIKQGVNAHGKKNLIGSFHPPLASINDYGFLATLERREISCGFAEIVKMALLRDPALLALLERHGAELLESRFASPVYIARQVTRRAELLMLEELAPNLFEENLARLVDFGHTFSPAIEMASHFEISHGYAVALDMLLSVALASPDLLPRLAALFKTLGLPCCDARMPEAATLLEALAEVRRHRGGSLNLVVIRRPGEPYFLRAVSHRELARALALVSDLALPVKAEPHGVSAGNDYDRPSL